MLKLASLIDLFTAQAAVFCQDALLIDFAACSRHCCRLFIHRSCIQSAAGVIIGCMSSCGYLKVGSFRVTSHRDGVDNELLALFRDDMLHIESAMASEYYTTENGYADVDEFGPADAVDDEIATLIYSSPGYVIADRLDVMGATPVTVDVLYRGHGKISR